MWSAEGGSVEIMQSGERITHTEYGECDLGHFM